jgi:hypothetical protein
MILSLLTLKNVTIETINYAVNSLLDAQLCSGKKRNTKSKGQ